MSTTYRNFSKQRSSDDLLTVASERQAERLASLSAADNRISYGCFNLPPAFYERHVQPIFARPKAIIYVLLEVKSVQQLFGPRGQ